MSQWRSLTISSSATPFSFCLLSFPELGSFRLFTSGDQSIRASASASILPKNIQGWFPLRLTWSPSSPRDSWSRVFSSTTIQKHQFFGAQPSLWSNSLIHTWYWKKHSFDYLDCCWKKYVLLFNMLSRFVRTFLPRRKHLLFHDCSYYLQRFWRPRKYNLSLFPLFPLLFAMKLWDKMPWFAFDMLLTFKPLFHSPLSPSSKRLFNSSWISANRMVLSAYLRGFIFLPAILIPACDSSNPPFHMTYSA